MIAGQDKQRAWPAIQLLSKSVAEAIDHIFINGHSNDLPSTDLEYWKELSDFIKEADQWIDVFNSHKEIPNQDWKKVKYGFGLHLEEQLNALEKFKSRVKNLLVLGHNKRIDWQIGVETSSNALPLLFGQLQLQYQE